MSRKLGGVLLSLVIYIILPLQVQAADFTISVKPEIPSNQQGNVRGYFNVQMKPTEKKEYVIQVANKGSDEKRVEVKVLNAGTATDGKIDYTNLKPRLSASMGTKLTELVTVKDELTIPANSVEKLKFLVEMPKKVQPGIILGSIFILDKGQETKNQAASEGMSIHNQMGYPVQMMLSMTNEQVKADLGLDQVEVGTHSGHPSLEIPLENKNPNIIPDITVTTEISKKGSEKILVTDTKTDNTIAPYAIFAHQVKLTDKKVTSGVYTAHILAQSEFGNWEWNRDFKITTQLAEDLNESSMQAARPTWFYWLIVVGILAILVIGYLLYQVRKLASVNKKDQ